MVMASPTLMTTSAGTNSTCTATPMSPARSGAAVAAAAMRPTRPRATRITAAIARASSVTRVIVPASVSHRAVPPRSIHDHPSAGQPSPRQASRATRSTDPGVPGARRDPDLAADGGDVATDVGRRQQLDVAAEGHDLVADAAGDADVARRGRPRRR